jgi:hypothetical protein
MKGSDIFAGKSLKSADIQGHEPVVTIEKVTTQTFNDNTTKPIIHFRGKDKVLVCNKTNWNSIVEITGLEDSDDWTGQKIRLVVARVEFQGQRVPAIRIEPAGSGTTRQAPPTPPPSLVPPEDIPF